MLPANERPKFWQMITKKLVNESSGSMTKILANDHQKIGE